MPFTTTRTVDRILNSSMLYKKSGPSPIEVKQAMSGSGLVVGAIAIFLGQPICHSLGLPSWAATIFQVVCRLLGDCFVVVN
jgi:hypothetical protein